MPAVTFLVPPLGLSTLRRLPAVEQWLFGAGGYRHIGLAAYLYDLERVMDPLIHPGVTTHDADADHLDVRCHQEHGNGQDVSRSGAEAVLVDENLDPFLARGRAG